MIPIALGPPLAARPVPDRLPAERPRLGRHQLDVRRRRVHVHGRVLGPLRGALDAADEDAEDGDGLGDDGAGGLEEVEEEHEDHVICGVGG